MCFEGQAAMELEFALDGVETEQAYQLAIGHRPSAMELDWSPMIHALLADAGREVSAGEISAKFHNALAEAIVAVAKRVGPACVVLSGGCFQNRYLTERAVHRLRAAGLQPHWHQRVPPNDGGIALGQVVAALQPNGWLGNDFATRKISQRRDWPIGLSEPRFNGRARGIGLKDSEGEV
jgi:hydrogenase maturation protein HypF